MTITGTMAVPVAPTELGVGLGYHPADSASLSIEALDYIEGEWLRALWARIRDALVVDGREQPEHLRPFWFNAPRTYVI